MRVQSLRCLWLLTVVLLAPLGCGKPGPVKVEGVLTWEDGKPIDGAAVVFMPQGQEGKSANGATGKDGTFTLTTTKSGDGAMPGEYKVVVTRVASDGTPADASPADLVKMLQKGKGKAATPENDLPKVYSTAATTPLTYKVESGGGKAELKLKKS